MSDSFQFFSSMFGGVCDAIKIKSKSTMLDSILEYWPPQVFTRTTTVLYPDQTPNVCLFLVHGSVAISYNKCVTSHTPIKFVGIKELLNLTPVPSSVIITRGTQVSLIDRPSLLRLIKNDTLFGRSIQRLTPLPS